MNNGSTGGARPESPRQFNQGRRQLTFYEEARMIQPENSNTYGFNGAAPRATLAEVRARNKVRIKTQVSKEELKVVD